MSPSLSENFVTSLIRRRYNSTRSALDNVRTNSMRAFYLDEMKNMVDKVMTPYDLLREGQ